MQHNVTQYNAKKSAAGPFPALSTVLMALIFTTFALSQTPPPKLVTLYAFTGGSGGNLPFARITGSDGVIYGTTQQGGTGCGDVYSLTAPASPGGTWTETELYSFLGSPDGCTPTGTLAIGSGGILYGTTQDGGTANYGTVFSLTPPTSPAGAWTEAILYNFAATSSEDGEGPMGGVVIGSGGVLYGTTPFTIPSGGGTVFSLTPPTSPGGAWTEAVLVNLNSSTQGIDPEAGVVIAPDGALYGTLYGGEVVEYGGVFALRPPASPGGSWTYHTLYDFQGGTDASNPRAGVVFGSGGVLYGTTLFGGTSGEGAVYSLTPPTSPGGGWTETVLYSFTGGSDGAQLAGVVVGGGGVLYGAATFGGDLIAPCYGGGCGTLFSLTPPSESGGAWTETTLYTFTNSDGADPFGGVTLTKAGVLLGTTGAGGSDGDGTVFALKP